MHLHGRPGGRGGNGSGRGVALNDTPIEKGLGVCAVCSKQSSQRCAGCRQVNYCSRNHQRLHWSRHKATCAKLKNSQPGQGQEESNDAVKAAENDACEKHDGSGDSVSGSSKKTDKKECALCRKPSGLRCGGCWQVHYCCKDHQKKHRLVHKEACKPYRVDTNEELGRHLVATRPIHVGETVLVSSAAVRGPSKEKVTCLGCSRIMESGWILLHQCGSCGFPMCSRACESHPLHAAECSAICSRGIRQSRDAVLQWYKLWRFGLANAILTLRCLLLPKKEYQKICRLQSNLQQMRNDTVMGMGANVRIVVNFIRGDLGLTEFSVENISRVAAIAITNGSSLPHADHSIQMTALYSSDESLIEHSCIPNAMKVFRSVEDESEITVMASREINCEDHISITYVNPMYGNFSRHIRIVKWFFRCKCNRCLDRTELGLYMNSICCEKCTWIRGKMSMIVCSNPSKMETSSWKCEHCEYSIRSDEFQRCYSQLISEYSSLDDWEEHESFMEENLWPNGLLHPNHEFIINSKMIIVDSMGSQAVGAKMVQYCRDLEHCCGKLQPSAFKGYYYRLIRIMCEMKKLTNAFPKNQLKLETVKDKLQSVEEDLVLASSYNMGASELFTCQMMTAVVKVIMLDLKKMFNVYTTYC